MRQGQKIPDIPCELPGILNCLADRYKMGLYWLFYGMITPPLYIRNGDEAEEIHIKDSAFVEATPISNLSVIFLKTH
jgi:hypothetical protein